MSGILQAILSFCELEVRAAALPTSHRGGASLTRALVAQSILLVRGKGGGEGLNFSSHMPRFQEMYTLAITPLPTGSLGLASAPKFRPVMTSTQVEVSEDGSQKQGEVRLAAPNVKHLKSSANAALPSTSLLEHLESLRRFAALAYLAHSHARRTWLGFGFGLGLR